MRPFKTRLATVSLVLAMLTSSLALGDWAQLSPEQFAQQSDLIVLGQCVGLDRLQVGESSPALNIGVIQVESVLKGDSTRTVALLQLPPTRPKGLVASGDISVKQGQRGLWYLKKLGEGLYKLYHPDGFVPLDAAAPQIQALRKRPAP